MESISESTDSQEMSENFSMQPSFRSYKEILELIEGESEVMPEFWRRIFALSYNEKISVYKWGEADSEKLSKISCSSSYDVESLSTYKSWSWFSESSLS